MLIGLYSPVMKSGKSTVAQYLANKGFLVLSFASPLKDMLATLVDQEYIFGSKKEEEVPILGYTGRKLMQTLGTEWGRLALDEDFWVRHMEARIKVWSELGKKNFVIDDMRYPNEFRWVISKGGKTWKILRPGQEITSAHTSEGALDQMNFDEILINDKKLEVLKKKVNNLIGY